MRNELDMLLSRLRSETDLGYIYGTLRVASLRQANVRYSYFRVTMTLRTMMGSDSVVASVEGVF
jgi:hypothetical protein